MRLRFSQTVLTLGEEEGALGKTIAPGPKKNTKPKNAPETQKAPKKNKNNTIESDDIVVPAGPFRGWWCRDRDGWWMYQIPTSSSGQTWVDWYWYGKDKEGKDEWWSPTRSRDPAPWEVRRADDGEYYTYKQFLAHYGEWGNGMWCSAGGRRVCVGYI